MSKIEVNTIDVACGSTITLGSSGKTVQIACGASTVGMGRTGTVDWCTTAKTSPFTAVNGKGYFLNTTSGTITVTLPSSPSPGDIVAFKDYAKTWDTFGVSVARNGSKIAGSCLNASLTTEAQSVTLIYVDNTQGWIDIHDSTSNITGAPDYIVATGGNTTITCGDFKTHIFTADGPFNVTSAGNPTGSAVFDYLIVAGGAAGGASNYIGSGSGGGGAGGFRIFSSAPGSNSPLVAPAGLNASQGDFTITVGGGGAGAGPVPSGYTTGGSGTVSTFSTITSAGGGGGSGGSSPTAPAANGGSGGGSGYNPLPASGQGNTPPVSPPQGNPGGNSNTGGSFAASGGGGAGAAGAAAPGCHTGGAGGVGSYIADSFFGPTAPSYGTPGPVSSVRYFAGGGGGGGIAGYSPTPSVTAGAGGAGGGGAGGGEPVPTRPGVAGTANTGGASGGTSASYSPPAAGLSTAGGSGFVAIRYKFQN